MCSSDLQAIATSMPDLEPISEERIPTLQPAQNVERQTTVPMPAVLERRASKYDKMFENILREPSYKRRNMKLVVATDATPRRREVVRDDVEEQGDKAPEKELF